MRYFTLFSLSLLFLLSACFRDNDEIDNSEDIAFLEENASREGVEVTENGLQYRVLEEGDGETPNVDSRVHVNYNGKLIDGEEFDNSDDRDEPTEFFLGQVIFGFAEGLLLMQEGAQYELVIPSELAYGNNPPPESIIYPGATLIFEVELVEVL